MSRAPNSPFLIAFAGLFAMAAAMGIGRFAYTPILPTMMDDLGLDASGAGLIASANYLGYLLGAVLAAYGWAAGLERRIVIVGLAATTLLLAAMGLVENVWTMALIRLAAGFASAFVMIFSAAIVLSHGAAARRPAVQSIHFGGVGTGMALSSLLVGVITLSGHSWRGAWFAMAVVSAAALLVVLLLMPRHPISAGGNAQEPALRWTPQLVCITLAYGIFGFGYIITATFLVAIVREGGGSASFEMVVWLVTGLAAAVSVACVQPLVQRFGLRPVFAMGCLVEAAGVAASVLVPSPIGPLVGGLLLGATFVMVTAYGLQLGRAMAPLNQRRIFALMTAAFGIGQIVGPLVAGAITDLTGTYTLASLAGAAALLLSAALSQRITPA
ncbi:YbfB/YjiJ family MFS transporter [Pararhizobium haloflavum]|uniref:YbfB/YjiJ family MFS transporter n=1 Tax=Pararhizobium haloflavum TaxID=2037914 RepID=UPI000C1988C5|nr:YbfB/YjiJ family MFS transporter [Pararhizobium haloflavum]